MLYNALIINFVIGIINVTIQFVHLEVNYLYAITKKQ